MSENLTSRTILDFGRQWMKYSTFDGYYGSIELLADHFSPLLPMEKIRGARVAEIGAGAGRVVHMLLGAGAEEVVAVEPSESFEVLRANTAAHAGRVTCLKMRGDEIPADLALDYIFSIGVLHHIPDPAPVVKAALGALRPGGCFLAWHYGREGNEAYLRVAEPLRVVTRRLPHWALAGLCHALTALLDVYIVLCRFLPLPVRGYVRNVLRHFNRRARYIVVYDQLNPAYAKYYTGAEARALFEEAGFEDVRLFHRHGYSWSVIGRKPDRQGRGRPS